MKIITLTSNTPIYLNADKIISFIRINNTTTAITIIGVPNDLYVSESPEEIVALINN